MATNKADDEKKKEVRREFGEVVNMTASQIDKWLDTDESKSVGQTKPGNDESTGHKSGKKIIDILNKKVADYSDADYEHMQKVVSYVRRHSAQEPQEVDGSNWLYSLKNWGHDPSK